MKTIIVLEDRDDSLSQVQRKDVDDFGRALCVEEGGNFDRAL